MFDFVPSSPQETCDNLASRGIWVSSDSQPDFGVVILWLRNPDKCDVWFLTSWLSYALLFVAVWSTESMCFTFQGPATLPLSSYFTNPAIANLKHSISTGEMLGWQAARKHVQVLITENCAAYEPIKEGHVINAVTGHSESVTEQINRVVGLLDAPQFKDSPPFTVQRMAELLTNPYQYYPRNQLAKYLRALERVLLVSSSVADYGKIDLIDNTPTMESGEKIKPDSGIVLTPIPWIPEEDELKTDPDVEEDETDADVVDDGSEDGPDSDQITVHDVSVEMTDADLSAEMATHDVPSDVAVAIRQVKENEINGDLLQSITASVTEPATETAITEGATEATTQPDDILEAQPEPTTDTPGAPTDAQGDDAPQDSPVNTSGSGSSKEVRRDDEKEGGDTSEDRETKRLKTE